MVLLELVIGKQKMSSSDILQKNDHPILPGWCQFVANNFNPFYRK